MTKQVGRGRREMTDKTKKALTLLGVFIFLALSAAVVIYVGRPMIAFISEPEAFREWVDAHGIWGRLAFVGMFVLQIIVAIIPGEPLEIAAGYAFGVIEGTLLSLIGILIGSIVVFWFVRRFGVKAVEVFFSVEKTNSLRFLRDAKRRNFLIFVVFFIPGTPKDLLTYFVGLTDIKFSNWVLIATIARFPSVITSIIGGDALGLQQYDFAILVFLVTFVVGGVGLLVFNWWSKRKNTKKEEEASEGSEEKNDDPDL